METRRWINQSQPQTLYIAVFLLYLNAAFAVFGMVTVGYLPIIGLALAGATVAAGYGIANERKWGYYLGIAVSALPFVLRYLYAGNPLAGDFLSVIFDIALIALLVHPQSREYTRIWFK